MLHLAAQYTDLELLVWMLDFAAEHAFPLGMSNDQAGSSALDYAIQNQWWQVSLHRAAHLTTVCHLVIGSSLSPR